MNTKKIDDLCSLSSCEGTCKNLPESTKCQCDKFKALNQSSQCLDSCLNNCSADQYCTYQTSDKTSKICVNKTSAQLNPLVRIYDRYFENRVKLDVLVSKIEFNQTLRLKFGDEDEYLFNISQNLSQNLVTINLEHNYLVKGDYEIVVEIVERDTNSITLPVNFKYKFEPQVLITFDNRNLKSCKFELS